MEKQYRLTLLAGVMLAMSMGVYGQSSTTQKATDVIRDTVREERKTALVVWPPTEKALADVRIAQQLIDVGDYVSAIKFLEGVTKEPHLARATKMLSELYGMQGEHRDTQKARDWSSKAWEMHLAESRMAFEDAKRAEKLISSGDYAKAAQILEVSNYFYPSEEKARPLAELYAEGRGVQLNQGKALDLFIQSRDVRAFDYLCAGETADAERGWALLQEWSKSSVLLYMPHTRLGLLKYRCYSRTENPDPKTAYKYLSDAAYINPSPFRDNTEALRYLPAVKAELKNPYYLYDRAGAVQKYMKPAEAGDVSAMIELYHAYSDGRGAPQNRQLAFEWIMKAASVGDGFAQTVVGEAYLNGYVPVERDYQAAIQWLAKGAEHGQWLAASMLSDFYKKGLGGKPDSSRAQFWANRCNELGGKCGGSRQTVAPGAQGSALQRAFQQ